MRHPNAPATNRDVMGLAKEGNQILGDMRKLQGQNEHLRKRCDQLQKNIYYLNNVIKRVTIFSVVYPIAILLILTFIFSLF